MNGEQAEEDELSEPSLQALPLVDISIAGRRFRTQQKEVERFGAQLVQGLTQEMNRLSDGDQKSGLDQAGKFLLKGIAHLTLTAAAIPDRGQGAKVLKASLDLMFACADTASRIDRKLVPRIIEPMIEKRLTPIIEKSAKKALGEHGGKASGKKRRAETEEFWRPHAHELAIEFRQERPGITQIELANEIKNAWRLKIHCPETQLIRAISRWEKDGRLTKRNK